MRLCGEASIEWPTGATYKGQVLNKLRSKAVHFAAAYLIMEISIVRPVDESSKVMYKHSVDVLLSWFEPKRNARASSTSPMQNITVTRLKRSDGYEPWSSSYFPVNVCHRLLQDFATASAHSLRQMGAANKGAKRGSEDIFQGTWAMRMLRAPPGKRINAQIYAPESYQQDLKNRGVLPSQEVHLRRRMVSRGAQWLGCPEQR